MRNILDYGAVGDGVTVNTRAIQAAIDEGGTVYIPEGVFVTGTLYLKSHGGLHLAPGAVLRASHNREDYNALDYCPQNTMFAAEFMVGTHLVTAVEQEDVFIEGHGTIDGDSHFWVNEKHMSGYCRFFSHPPLSDNRPGQMIYFVECKGVRVTDIKLRYSPFWHLFLHGCEDVFIRGLDIKGERHQWVNDGIDIDTCKRVTVSDCIIDTGDDAITLRASYDRLLHSDGVCKDVTVTNCVLTSYLDYGIRVGVGTGKIERCRFSNIIIKDSLSGIGLTSRFSPKRGKGVSVEDLHFADMTVEALTAFEVKLSNELDFPPFEEETYIKNTSFRGITAYSCRPSYVIGFEGGEISDVRFLDVLMHMKAEDSASDRYPCNWNSAKNEKAAFYAKDAEGVLLQDVRFEIEGDHPFGENIKAENCEGFCVK